ncbi:MULTISPECIES: IPExxxVDY family protein [Myroides]|uniref:IPExxxVDY family protein n=1 Tax=Myroides albus TaxID=2562892 RepID=A0A6I3LH47_9FLAO|nr:MULTISPECIES: IPExxxVDY family protein [Myroides]MTG97553.1 IPExxxVDY family protein [Myroides albus]MVX35077.1 IPExxxVDY family protein [Myroides sp. LoEW2-1]UVD81170.1 IPExxxVDY family protein [Myroides albus]
MKDSTKVIKLTLDDFDIEDYKLIAIHSSKKEDYKVVYSINTTLELFLVKEEKDITITTDEGFANFPHFEYEDHDHHILWKVVANKAFIKPDTDIESPLFSDKKHAITKQGYLVPELKNVDYLIKIEDTDEYFDIGIVLEKLNSIKIFSTAYEVRQETIKNRKNLIF